MRREYHKNLKKRKREKLYGKLPKGVTAVSLEPAKLHEAIARAVGEPWKRRSI